eukprot:CAMPEP_0182882876 /NCGR_PEP_ID=MMETSP0034_2-20130328/18051_1 /TAXON_ID=156128 /ORGANISM="Nephroselmis pyriformis, Strain CCMP717" /LENGTH=287 /DNA_ID=CAMNT_0025015993 /DNA_START=182 /DNA_END=1041 /DNA_ORIENTATION=+
MGCYGSKLSESKAVVMRRDSYKCFVQFGCSQAALDRCVQMFTEGSPNKMGQLDHDGFCSIFALKRDEYTDRLVRIFDIDNSGSISLREFIYGLSKFSGSEFELKVQFAYRLFDLDGDGTLDKFELTTALRSALNIDDQQYDTKIRKTMVPNGFVYERPDKGVVDDEKVKAVINEIAGIKNALKYEDFQRLITRFPKLFLPASRLYDMMNQFSTAPQQCVQSLTRENLEQLLRSLNRAMDYDGSAFGDRKMKKGETRVLSASMVYEGQGGKGKGGAGDGKSKGHAGGG